MSQLSTDVAEQATATAHFAVLEISTHPEFTPESERHVPPLVACWLSHKQARDLAIALNADVVERQAGGPWHFLVCCGKNRYGVLRLTLQGTVPTDPRAVPESLTECLVFHAGMKSDARERADDANRHELRRRHHPQFWNVVIRDLTDATPDEEPDRRKPVEGPAGRPTTGKPTAYSQGFHVDEDGSRFTLKPRG